MTKYKWLAKATHGAAVAGLGAVGAALVEDQSISTSEWVTVGLAVLIAFGVVFQSGPKLPPVTPLEGPHHGQ